MGRGLHLFAVQFVIHVAVDALGHHNRQGHGLVLLELLAVGVLEALDEAEAIAILYTRARPILVPSCSKRLSQNFLKHV